jgi:hypothetical protein
MADDGQMMVAKTVGKNFAYLTYQQIFASGVVHTTTFQQSIWLELPHEKKTNHTILSFQTSVQTYIQLLPEQLSKLEILRVYLGAMAANLRMSPYAD